jgi:hypothetical protein
MQAARVSSTWAGAGIALDRGVHWFWLRAAAVFVAIALVALTTGPPSNYLGLPAVAGQPTAGVIDMVDRLALAYTFATRDADQ